MDTTTTASLAFLPWVRQGAAAGLQTQDSGAAGQPVPMTLSAVLSLNDSTELRRDVRLLGPGDVLGLDTQQIVRMEPPPGSTAFEPNHFAAIEFDRPDFPWLFTPARAGDDGRLRPWLCLVVLRVQPGVQLHPASGNRPLPVLEIRAPARWTDELPDLADTWAWAHAQAARADGIDVQSALTGRPELSLSRLLCPRLLDPVTDYLACVVPCFEVGRQAGLGAAVAEADTLALTPAWSLASDTAPPLPVYHHWSFRTGPWGDFEDLARRLRPQPAPAGMGSTPIDISRPGFMLPAGFPAGSTLPLGGALAPAGAGDAAPDDDWPAGAAALFRQALAPLLNAGGTVGGAGSGHDPVLAPPLYGRWHAAKAQVGSDGSAGADWFEQLNLDPRHRATAALGTQVVQQHQETLMASAWAQAADMQRSNQRRQQLQMGMEVADRLHLRHFGRMSSDALLRVAAPLLGGLQRGGGIDAGVMLLQQLRSTPLSGAALGAAMRRLSRPRGPISRRVVALRRSTTGTAGFLMRLGGGAAAGFVQPPRPDLVGFSSVRERLAEPGRVAPYSAVTAINVEEAPPPMGFQVRPEGTPLAVVGTPVAEDSADAAIFRSAARLHLARVNPGRLNNSPTGIASIDLDAVRTELLAQTAPRQHWTSLAAAGRNTTERVVAGTATPAPLRFAPHDPQPMYKTLLALSQDLLLPGLGAVPPNAVVGLQTNRRFVEAFMVGLNHEMGRELLWRGFPTDQRGTCFDQFWDVRGTAAGTPDILPLHTWGTRSLGAAAGAPAQPGFVLLLRSDLLRRYPRAVVCATPALRGPTGLVPSRDAAQEVYPSFRGDIDPDIGLFGFALTPQQMVGTRQPQGGDAGWFIVIQEQPTEPRFGLDSHQRPAAGTHLRAAGTPPRDLPPGLQWGRNAAHVAGCTQQLPVRMAIHAARLIILD